jgi:ATP-dependent DNA helicase RecG
VTAPRIPARRPAGASTRRSARAPAARPTDPAAILDLPIGASGLPGAATVARTRRHLGIATIRDLLFHLPRRYDDLRELRKVGELGWTGEGEVISARVRVADLRVEPTFRRRVQRTIAEFEDETGSITATWFGRRYIERRLGVGDRVVVSGRIKHFGRRLTLDNPEFQRDDESALLHVGRIVPVYRITAGITGATLRRAMRGALDWVGRAYPEYLPSSIVAERHLTPIGEALEEAQPRSRGATRPSIGWPSTSCSRSRWAWSAGVGGGSGKPPPRSASATWTTNASGRRSPTASASRPAGA